MYIYAEACWGDLGRRDVGTKTSRWLHFLQADIFKVAYNVRCQLEIGFYGINWDLCVREFCLLGWTASTSAVIDLMEVHNVQVNNDYEYVVAMRTEITGRMILENKKPELNNIDIIKGHHRREDFHPMLALPVPTTFHNALSDAAADGSLWCECTTITRLQFFLQSPLDGSLRLAQT